MLFVQHLFSNEEHLVFAIHLVHTRHRLTQILNDEMFCCQKLVQARKIIVEMRIKTFTLGNIWLAFLLFLVLCFCVFCFFAVIGVVFLCFLFSAVVGVVFLWGFLVFCCYWCCVFVGFFVTGVVFLSFLCFLLLLVQCFCVCFCYWCCVFVFFVFRCY